ncbi:MAG: histidine kinase [Synergistaceae bacterium]|nr:histidine kinase [Synergistaceae bacterium]
MTKQKQQRKTRSLAMVLIMMCCLLTAFGCAGLYIMQRNQSYTMISQAAKTNLDALNAYTGDMDNMLRNLEMYMHNFIFNNRDIEILHRNVDEVSRFRGKQRILGTLDQIIHLNGLAECAWIYSPGDDRADFLARNAYAGISNVELTRLREIIIGIIEKNTAAPVMVNDRWSLISTEIADYLLLMVPGEDVYYGAWVRVSSLYTKFSDVFSRDNGGAVILSTLAGQLLTGGGGAKQSSTGVGAEQPLTGDDAKFQLVPEGREWAFLSDDLIGISSYSARADLAISAVLSKAEILRGTHFGFNMALLTAGMIVFILAVVIVYQYLMYRPFSRLIQKLYEISEGNFDLRLETKSRLREVFALEYSINHLLDVIEDLKIRVFDTQLRERNVTCQYLKIRIKTHFYLNCLSIIHAMARVKNTELIKELTMRLSHYLRFFDKEINELVRLEEELSHARNYAYIQELRFPNMFQYIEDVPFDLYGANIPPLILQTFIENSIEHAMLPNHPNWVRLQADYKTRNDLAGIHFQIADNGAGFNEEILRSLSEEAVQLDFSKSDSIGIRNVVSRLAVIYNGQATIEFRNSEDGGALIDMWLPT